MWMFAFSLSAPRHGGHLRLGHWIEAFHNPDVVSVEPSRPEPEKKPQYARRHLSDLVQEGRYIRMTHGEHRLVTFGAVGLAPSAVNIKRAGSSSGVKCVMFGAVFRYRDDFVGAEFDHEIADLDSGRCMWYPAVLRVANPASTAGRHQGPRYPSLFMLGTYCDGMILISASGQRGVAPAF